MVHRKPPMHLAFDSDDEKEGRTLRGWDRTPY